MKSKGYTQNFRVLLYERKGQIDEAKLKTKLTDLVDTYGHNARHYQVQEQFWS